jgi:hypothetical protein
VLIDLLSGMFAVAGGLVTWGNVLRLRRDTRIRGTHWVSGAVFAAWSVFNLVFYSALGQWLSLIGGIFMASGNVTWFVYAWRYRKQ